MLLFLMIIMCPILLSGCWDYEEIESLAIVSGVAIDKDEITSKYIVTAEIITTQMQGASSIISSELFISEGESVFSAVRNMIQKTGMKLFWSDAKVIIVSEQLAIEGVIPVIDWLNRSSDVRPDMWFLISKGETASEILKQKVRLNQVVGFHLDDTMKSGILLSKYTYSSLWSFIDRLTAIGDSQAVASVKNEINESTLAPRLSGSAIFKADKLVGYLDDFETLYMLMIRNNISGGLINIKNVSGTGTSVTLEIDQNITKLTPHYNNGSASLIVDIYPIVIISEVQGTKNFIEEKNLKTFQSEAENSMEGTIQSLITKLQKNDTDILGFGEVFRNNMPKISESFKKNGINIFTEMKTEVNVHLDIKSSGRMNDSIPLVK
ncbi:Ger(x)C family spore germination protein [Clostridium sp.]|uniref:Ger(x)C family spore germination protein n=1 Tax=Clostridium sp. TaxID=1506 RepID=UPI003F4B9B57